ncbi:MAG: hypothetical protein ACE15C_15500 [Phycisphaerae bacterium]
MNWTMIHLAAIAMAALLFLASAASQAEQPKADRDKAVKDYEAYKKVGKQRTKLPSLFTIPR